MHFCPPINRERSQINSGPREEQSNFIIHLSIDTDELLIPVKLFDTIVASLDMNEAGTICCIYPNYFMVTLFRQHVQNGSNIITQILIEAFGSQN